MPETNHTTNRSYPIPTGKDFVPEGPAEMAAIAEAVDAENRGEIDHLQAGVVSSTDWSFTASMENSATCALASTGTTGGIAWLPSTAVGLLRSVTAAATLKALVPSSLPSTGKYLNVGFELTPTTSGKAATVSVHAGVEKSTQAEAEAAPPATTSGKIKIRNAIIKNTSGVYSIVAQFDKRLWATGGEAATETVAEGRVGAEAVTNAKVKKGTLKGDRFEPATITGDKLAVNLGTYEAVKECKSGEENESHPARPIQVVLSGEGASGVGTRLRVEVFVDNSPIIPPLEVAGQGEVNLSVGPITFIVAAEKTWKAIITATGGKSLHYSRLVI